MFGIGHSLWLRSTSAASGIGKEVRKRQEWSCLSGVCGLSGSPEPPRCVCDTHISRDVAGHARTPFLWGSHCFWLLSRCLEPETARLLFHKGGESDLISRLGDRGKKEELNESSKYKINVRWSPEWNSGSPCSSFVRISSDFTLGEDWAWSKLNKNSFPLWSKADFTEKNQV